jgi:hypothetical protein
MNRKRQRVAAEFGPLATLIERERREASVEGPPREREQHGRVTRDTEQTKDSRGAISVPWRGELPLERLARHGTISEAELDAGNEFRRLYRIAFLDPLRAASFDERIPGAVRWQPGCEIAKRQVNAILVMLGSKRGSLLASCAESVIGGEMAISTWARNLRWSGRRINDHEAAGVLRATLEVLVAHFARGPKKGA